MQNKKIYAEAEIFKAAKSSDDAATAALTPHTSGHPGILQFSLMIWTVLHQFKNLQNPCTFES